MKNRSAGLSYCLGLTKRSFDLCASGLALLVLSPALLLLALLLLLSSGRPILFAQERVGRGGRTFNLLKFRTMRLDSGHGLPITGRGDSRVTGLGRVLRALKLDELPQLINVLRGEMSIVGPRPEIPRYVALYDPTQRRVLDVRPGLTDTATLHFRDEEGLLGTVDADRRESCYLERILPRKLSMNLGYIEAAGFWSDLRLILRTLGTILSWRRS